MKGWSDISTAPRDGSIIEVVGIDEVIEEGPYVMQWDKTRKNPLVGDHAGMWVDPFGNFTWDESRGAGPTHWRGRR